MYDDNPEEYIPTALRPQEPQTRQEEVWCVGIEHTPNEVGMIGGPYPALGQALEDVPPPGSEGRIVHFKLDGTDQIIYHWKEERWIKVKNPMQDSEAAEILPEDVLGL